MENEPIFEDEILASKENILISPHIGSRTYQSVERQATMAVKNLIKMIDEENTRG